jgi:hypothetical protein
LALAAWLLDGTPPAAGAAAIVTVDRFDDPPLGGVACTETPADCSLRQAMELANQAGDMIIQLPPGTYDLVLAGAGEDTNQTGDLDYTDLVGGELQIVALTNEPTIIMQQGQDRILDLHPGVSLVSLVGVTLTNGDLLSGSGGAVRTAAEGLGLLDSVVEASQTSATASGGCIFHDASGPLEAVLTIVDSVIRGCGGGLGGAVASNQPPAGVGSMTVIGSRFEGNGASGGLGGAIAIFGGEGSLTVADSVFAHNRASQADAGGLGGAILARGAQLRIERSTFVGNRAGELGDNNGAGGSLYLAAQEYVSLPPDPTPPPVPTVASLTNVTIHQSETRGNAQRGAAIYVESSQLELVHATITESWTNGQHALFVATGILPAILDLEATLLDGGCDTFNSPTLTSSGYNVEVPPGGSTTTTCNLGAMDQVGVPLRLRPLAVYGGPSGVPTRMPLVGDPGLDRVPSAACSAFDARTAPRSGTTCDGGAHELGAPAPGPWIFADGFESGDVGAWSSLSP